MRRFALPVLWMFFLAACAPTQAPANLTPPEPGPVSEALPTPTDDPALLPTLFPNAGGENELTRLDDQGAVAFEVTPLNLGTPAATLEFEVAMNTHSVDLSMDLAALSTLSTDTGISIQSTEWDAIPGGHHVQGKLIFSATQGGKPILEGASKLTLTIVDIDAASRVFEWALR